MSLTLVEVSLVEVIGSRNIHVVQASDLLVSKPRQHCAYSPTKNLAVSAFGRTHIAMSSEVLQQLDLTESSLGENLLAKDIGNLLDGDTFIGLVVHGGAIDVDSCQLEDLRRADWRGRTKKPSPARHVKEH